VSEEPADYADAVVDAWADVLPDPGRLRRRARTAPQCQPGARQSKPP